MKFYHKDKSYPLIWKTQMRKGMWYNMEPAKLHITIPMNVYKEMIDCSLDPTQRNSFNFRVSKLRLEKIGWGLDPEKFGLFDIECFLYSSTISSKFKNNIVTIVLDVCITSFEVVEDKSIMRDLILGELI